MLITFPQWQSIKNWYSIDKFIHSGSGCEAEIYYAKINTLEVKLKKFKRKSEFRRHVVGTILLQSILDEKKWTSYVRLPAIYGIDYENNIVLSRYIQEGVFEPEDDQIGAQWAQAVMALICTAGIAMDINEMEFLRRTQILELLSFPDPLKIVFTGVDYGGDNLIFDGEIWNAVDF